MAGPGGTEVGRVSVRVVPDLDNFRSDVERELKKIEQMEAKIQVTLDLEKFKAQIQEIKAQLKSIQDETVNVKIDKNSGIGKFGDGLKRLGIDVDHFKRAVREMGNESEGADKKVSRWTRTFTGIGNLFSNAAKGAADLGKSIGGQLASSFQNVAQSLTQLIVQMVIWIPLLAAAAAGITFLVGAAGALIAGLPAALFGLAGPIAAVILGFDGIKKALQPLKPEFDKLKSTLSDTFANGMKGLVDSIKPLFPVITDGLNEAAKAVIRFGDTFMKKMNENVGGSGVTALDNLKKVLSQIGDFLDAMAGGFGTFVQNILQAAAASDALKIMGKIFGDLFYTAGGFFDQMSRSGKLQEMLNNLNTILNSLADLFIVLLENAISFFNGATPGMKTFVDSLTTFFKGLDWQGLGKAFGDALAQVGDWLNKLNPQQVDSFTDSLKDLAKAFGNLFSGKSMDIIVSALQMFIDLVTGVVNALDWLLERLADIGDAIGNFFDGFSLFGEKGMSGLLSGLSSGGDSVLGWFGGLFDNIGGLFGNLPSLLSGGGSAAMGGLQEGITGGGGGVMGAAQGVKDGITGTFSDANSMLNPFGRDITGGLANGIRSNQGEAGRAAGDTKGSITGAFGGAGNWLVSTGSTIVNGLVSGIRSMFGSVRSALGALTSLIPSWKGPYSVDRKLLTPNGKVIMGSLIDGLESGYKPVKSLLGDMTTDIASTFGSPSLLSDIQTSGADISAVGTAQLNVAGQVESGGVATAVANALAHWNIVMDPTGIARLVKKGNTNLDRRK